MIDREPLVFIRRSLGTIKKEIIIVHNLKVGFKIEKIFSEENINPIRRFHYNDKFKYKVINNGSAISVTRLALSCYLFLILNVIFSLGRKLKSQDK